MFGALTAVDDLTSSFEGGDVCGLVGPNGSGKTTFLNLLSGVLPPSRGQVRLNAAEITGLPSHRVAQLGVARTFQLIRLVSGASALENVLCGLYRLSNDRRVLHALVPMLTREERKAHRRQANSALERMGILDFASTPVRELPFGLQRRVELARAVVSKPEVLLFDEPAAGITDADMRNLKQLIDEEAARGAAIVLVDHHLGFVVDVCPRLLVMNFGSVIFDGASSAAIHDIGVREAYIGL